jgi:hypothetical protein
MSSRTVLVGDKRDIVGVGFVNGYSWNELPSEKPELGQLVANGPLYGGKDSLASFSYNVPGRALTITNLNGLSPVFDSVSEQDLVLMQFVNGSNLEYGVFKLLGGNENTIFFDEDLPYPVDAKGTVLCVLPNKIIDVSALPVLIKSPSLIRGYWIRAGSNAATTHSITLEADLSLMNVVFFDYDNGNPTNSGRTALFFENKTKVVVPNLVLGASGNYISPGICCFNMGGLSSPIIQDRGITDAHTPSGYHTGTMELYSAVVTSRFGPLISLINGEVYTSYSKLIVSRGDAIDSVASEIKPYEETWFQSCCGNTGAGIYLAKNSTLRNSAPITFTGDYSYLIEADASSFDANVVADYVDIDWLIRASNAMKANIRFPRRQFIDGGMVVARNGASVVLTTTDTSVNIVSDQALLKSESASSIRVVGGSDAGTLSIIGADLTLVDAESKSNVSITTNDKLSVSGLRRVAVLDNSHYSSEGVLLDLETSLSPVYTVSNSSKYLIDEGTVMINANSPPLVVSSTGSYGVVRDQPPWPILPAIAEVNPNTGIGNITATYNSGTVVRTP